MVYTFPKAARSYDRSDRGAMHLSVVDGALPADLRGFVYVVAPTGREVEDGDRAGAIPFLNGDGTVYRIGLGSSPELRWALTKPPCFWAERGLSPKDTTDWGITRLFDDLRLGGRNLLNTAFQAVRFGADRDRVLVTYEAGRPFEIDPETLEVLTPVGRRDAWMATMMGGTPFELVAGTSHPAFDPGHDARGAAGPGVLFALNFVRDADLYIERLLRFLGLDDEYEELEAFAGGLLKKSEVVESLVEKAVAASSAPTSLLDVWPDVTAGTWKAWKRFRARTVLTEPEARLLFWDGASEPRAARLLDADGDPLELRESAHQMGVTENWVVCMDAAFKFEMDAVLPDLDFLPKAALALVRRRLSRVQPQTTKVHLVPRKALVGGAETRVVTVELPASCVHYFVDYADAGGTKIVLTAIDNAATDSAEFLLDDDSPAFLDTPDLPPEVQGMIACGVDVDRIVRFEIDVAHGKGVATPTASVADRERMWTLALATGPTQFTARPQGAVGDLYLFTHGLIPSAVSRLVWELYWGPEYPRRIVPAAEVAARAAAGGIAPRLLRYDARTPTVVADSYAVPPGWLVLSPQCVPGGTRGYVVSTAFSDTEKQIWIFDGANLAGGPLCKLAAPAGETLPWGYTLHTTYLEEAHARPPGGYRVGVKDDLVGVASVPSVVASWVLPNAYKPAAAPPVPPGAPVGTAASANAARAGGAERAAAAGVEGGAFGPRELLERLRTVYDEVGPRHPRAGVHTLDEALARFELDVLLALEPDRALLGTHLGDALAAPELADARHAALSAHAAVVDRVFAAVRPLDPIALPAAFPEAQVRSVIGRLAVRALRLWATERASSDVRSIVVGGVKTLMTLLRADPRAPERSALTRAVDVQGLASAGVLDRAAQARIVETLLHTLLGPGL